MHEFREGQRRLGALQDRELELQRQQTLEQETALSALSERAKTMERRNEELLRAMQEVSDRKEALETTVQEQEAKICELQTRMETIEKV